MREDGALYVRLPFSAIRKLERASLALGVTKKELVANLIGRYVNPETQRGLNDLDTMNAATKPRFDIDLPPEEPTRGSYSFHPYDPPEVMTSAQTAELLQLEEQAVLELAEAGDLPGRKLGETWRFSRAAVLAWLGPSPAS